MILSQKTQYSLRAIFDLALHYGGGPRKNADIARAQAIPPRFLEIILHQLKQEFVGSQRGREGGYYLTRNPAEVTVGDVIRYVQGPVSPVHCISENGKGTCRFRGACVFMPLWRRLESAMNGVCDSTTFMDLVDEEKRHRIGDVSGYSI